MTAEQFTHWLKGYLDAKKTAGTISSDLQVIDNKLRETNLGFPNFDPNKIIYAPPYTPPNFPSYPGTGIPYIGDPLPGQEPRITCGDTWTTNTTDEPFTKEKIQLNG